MVGARPVLVPVAAGRAMYLVAFVDVAVWNFADPFQTPVSVAIEVPVPSLFPHESL